MENEVYPSLEEKSDKPSGPDDVKINVDGGDAKPSPGKGDGGEPGEVNESTVKFLPADGTAPPGSAQHENATVNITRPNGTTSGEGDAFPGMSKEELMKFANDPMWVRVRWALLVLCLLLWLAILAGAIGIVVVAPKCPEPPNPEWWTNGILYQLQVESYKDSDGDGTGDFDGIASAADYLASLGVSGVWLSPISLTAGEYVGYDVTDYKGLTPGVGDLSDFTGMVSRLHEKGMKVVVEVIPNHTSMRHPWFLASSNTSHPEHTKYRDWYVWSDSGTRAAWRTVHGDPAWTKSPTPGDQRHFYHVKAASTADLNFRNADVRKAIKSVITFWMDQGVDGFYINDVLRLVETEDHSQKEAMLPNTDLGMDDYEKLNHENITVGLPQSYDILSEWSEHIKSYKKNSASDRLVLTGGESQYAGDLLSAGRADLYASQALLRLDDQCLQENKALCVRASVRETLTAVGGVDNLGSVLWRLGSSAHTRTATRLGGSSAWNTLLLLLPGTVATYYGEEIGMEDAYEPDIPRDKARDKFSLSGGGGNYMRYSRDFHRTPMQWNGEPNMGFTAEPAEGTQPVDTWLPLATSAKKENVKEQEADESSTLRAYKRVSKLRALRAQTTGDDEEEEEDATHLVFETADFLLLPAQGVLFTYSRSDGSSDDNSYLVVVNVAEEKRGPSQALTNDTLTMASLPYQGTVVEEAGPGELKDARGKLLSLGEALPRGVTQVNLSPQQGIVIKLGRPTDTGSTGDTPPDNTAPQE